MNPLDLQLHVRDSTCCVVCGDKRPSGRTAPCNKTCSKECAKVLRASLKKCTVCGKGGLRGGRSRTCSKECAAIHRGSRVVGQRECVICGKPYVSPHRLTCEAGTKGDCYIQLRRIRRYQQTNMEGVCHYSAPSHEEYANMISILHRKGHLEGKKPKGYTYKTNKDTKEIWWHDQLPAKGSPDYIDLAREAGSGEELQAYWNGVEQEVRKKGAHQPSVKKLQRSLASWLAGDQGTMGKSGSSGIQRVPNPHPGNLLLCQGA